MTNVLTVCPGCRRLLAAEPDGTVFCVQCASSSSWENLVSIIRPSEGWQEIGWLLRAVLAAVCFAVGVVGWDVLWSAGVGWGLKSATGSVLLGVAMQAVVAFAAALVLRRATPVGRINLQVALWSATLILVPGGLVVIHMLCV